jgi:hypothetical protein
MSIYMGSKPDGQAIAIATVVEAVLQSPSFVYRVEIGRQGGSEAGRFDDFETAAQLGFLLLDSIPDPPLWDAAVNGRLQQSGGLERELTRLVSLPRVRKNMARILSAWLDTKAAAEIDKDPPIAPALQQALAQETDLFIDDLLAQPAGLVQGLVTSTKMFVTKDTAPLYGVPAPNSTGFVQVNLPADRRRGILTHAGMLAAHAASTDTSIVERGLYLRREILCLPPLPPPPEGLLDGEELKKTLAGLKTERERSDHRLTVSPCSGCHAGIDTYGVLFENYDALGRFRAQYSSGATIDASASVMASPQLTGRVNNIVDLADRLTGAPDFHGCAVQKVLGYALGRHDEGSPRHCEVVAAQDRLMKSGGTVVELFRSVALSTALRTRIQ